MVCCFFSLISLAQDVDYTVQILLPLCTCNNLAIGLEHCWSLENILKKDKTISNEKRVVCHMYNISRTVAHLLPSPGTILVLLLFGALNFPFTSVVQCRGANVVGCLSYSWRLFRSLMISLACVLDKAIFPSLTETKYAAKAWTSPYPWILSGPAESYGQV